MLTNQVKHFYIFTQSELLMICKAFVPRDKVAIYYKTTISYLRLLFAGTWSPGVRISCHRNRLALIIQKEIKTNAAQRWH